MRHLNLGILAHVDAGKTSLTERLLHTAGVIDEVGSVDAGSTLTDSLALERQRGITIRSAVVSFVVDDVAVNLIDTPGHPDFIAEVERVLSVLDGAVLVVSAVEGVQPQTRVLTRALHRLGIPTIVFVNKIDRTGAAYQRVLDEIADRLTQATFPMGEVVGLGTRDARWWPYDDGPFASEMVRLGAHPVYFGSAITGAGVADLMAGVRELLPAADGRPDAPLSATVFKVERGPAGERIAYARIFTGTVRTRDRLASGKVTALSVFERGTAQRSDSASAGQIVVLRGLDRVQVGDSLGDPHSGAQHHFAPPTLETVVSPRRDEDRGALHVALTQLAEQDPLINLRRDELRQETSVSLYGEVQKEIIAATLTEEYGVEVGFRESTTVCIERPTGSGEAVEVIDVAPNPFLATVGLRVEPAPVGAGTTFGLEVELGSMPSAFFNAIEATVTETLREGLCGWQVTDCRVTLVRCGYWPRQSAAHATFDKSMSSTAGDFRSLTPLVLMSALQRAGTQVLEPVHHFRLEAPTDQLGVLLPALVQHRAMPYAPEPRGTTYVVEGDIPAARVHALELQLPTLTRGEGLLETVFDHYEPVRGKPPTRPRTDHDPLHRKDYLLAVTRRVSSGHSS